MKKWNHGVVEMHSKLCDSLYGFGFLFKKKNMATTFQQTTVADVESGTLWKSFKLSTLDWSPFGLAYMDV